MTKQEIYENVVQLTAQLKVTNVAVEIFETAKTGDVKAVENVFERFKNEKSELYQRIVAFGEEFDEMIVTGREGEIFGEEEDIEEGIYVFDPEKIDALSFYALTFFGNLDEIFFFAEWEYDVHPFLQALEESGYEEVSNYVCCQSWVYDVGKDEECPTLYHFLVNLFQ